MMTTNKPTQEGKKSDDGKPRLSLLPWRAVQQIVAVLEFGAAKYGADNWQHVPNARQRYFDAAMRHLLAWWDGERLDAESGLPHLAHAGCCILFLLWSDKDATEEKAAQKAAHDAAVLLAKRVKAHQAAQEARYAGR